MIKLIKSKKILTALIVIFTIIGCYMIYRSFVITTSPIALLDTWEAQTGQVAPDSIWAIGEQGIQHFEPQINDFWWVDFTIRCLFIIFFCGLAALVIDFGIDMLRTLPMKEAVILSLSLFVAAPLLGLIVRSFLDDSSLLQQCYNLIHKF